MDRLLATMSEGVWLIVRAYYSSISTRLPEILDCSFQWGLRTPILAEGEAVGGRGWYVSKERWRVSIGYP